MGKMLPDCSFSEKVRMKPGQNNNFLSIVSLVHPAQTGHRHGPGTFSVVVSP